MQSLVKRMKKKKNKRADADNIRRVISDLRLERNNLMDEYHHTVLQHSLDGEQSIELYFEKYNERVRELNDLIREYMQQLEKAGGQ